MNSSSKEMASNTCKDGERTVESSIREAAARRLSFIEDFSGCSGLFEGWSEASSGADTSLAVRVRILEPVLTSSSSSSWQGKASKAGLEVRKEAPEPPSACGSGPQACRSKWRLEVQGRGQCLLKGSPASARSNKANRCTIMHYARNARFRL